MSFKWFFLFLSFLEMLSAGAFRIVTYNILSDDFLWEGVYDYVDPKILDWQMRRERILKRIQAVDPDVICLQELNVEAYAWFSEALDGFESAFAKKGGSSRDGLGTFCKKGVFQAVDHRSILCPGTSICGSGAVQPAIFSELSLPNGKKILLVHTKIKWSCSSVRAGPIWNHIQFILESTQKKTAILVGDFNMESDHPFMSEFYLADFYDSLANTYSCYANGIYKKVDYILCTKDLQSEPFETFSASLAEMGLIPNEREPSDHLPMGSRITYE